jgi:oxalate decarboxylase/phosphoglucose isomerase-like protein (cupin superfamily)
MYHRENDQEDFLVLAGEALAIVEGEERPLRQWDFVHCPAGTNHVLVGAGDGPAVLAAGAGPLDRARLGRLHGRRGGATPRRGVEQETTDAKSVRPVPRAGLASFPRGWLPD